MVAAHYKVLGVFSCWGKPNELVQPDLALSNFVAHIKLHRNTNVALTVCQHMYFLFPHVCVCVC